MPISTTTKSNNDKYYNLHINASSPLYAALKTGDLYTLKSVVFKEGNGLVLDGKSAPHIRLILGGSSSKNQTACLLIHIACRWNNSDLVSELLNLGLEPDTKDQDGNSPLHLCAQFNHEATAMVLIDKLKAKLTPLKKDYFQYIRNVKNNNDKTPLEVAIARCSGDMVKLLEQFCQSQNTAAATTASGASNQQNSPPRMTPAAQSVASTVSPPSPPAAASQPLNASVHAAMSHYHHHHHHQHQYADPYCNNTSGGFTHSHHHHHQHHQPPNLCSSMIAKWISVTSNANDNPYHQYTASATATNNNNGIPPTTNSKGLRRGGFHQSNAVFWNSNNNNNNINNNSSNDNNNNNNNNNNVSNNNNTATDFTFSHNNPFAVTYNDIMNDTRHQNNNNNSDDDDNNDDQQHEAERNVVDEFPPVEASQEALLAEIAELKSYQNSYEATINHLTQSLADRQRENANLQASIDSHLSRSRLQEAKTQLLEKTVRELEGALDATKSALKTTQDRVSLSLERKSFAAELKHVMIIAEEKFNDLKKNGDRKHTYTNAQLHFNTCVENLTAVVLDKFHLPLNITSLFKDPDARTTLHDSLELVFHSTKRETLANILCNGFDPKFRGAAHGQARGNGEYYGTCDAQGFQLASRYGSGAMIVCLVVKTRHLKRTNYDSLPCLIVNNCNCDLTHCSSSDQISVGTKSTFVLPLAYAFSDESMASAWKPQPPVCPNCDPAGHLAQTTSAQSVDASGATAQTAATPIFWRPVFQRASMNPYSFPSAASMTAAAAAVTTNTHTTTAHLVNTNTTRYTRVQFQGNHPGQWHGWDPSEAQPILDVINTTGSILKPLHGVVANGHSYTICFRTMTQMNEDPNYLTKRQIRFL